MNKKQNKEHEWIYELIVGLIGLILFFIYYLNYEEYVHTTETSFGKGSKIFLLIAKILDKIGGKYLVLSLIFFLSVYIILSSIRKINK